MGKRMQGTTIGLTAACAAFCLLAALPGPTAYGATQSGVAVISRVAFGGPRPLPPSLSPARSSALGPRQIPRSYRPRRRQVPLSVLSPDPSRQWKRWV